MTYKKNYTKMKTLNNWIQYTEKKKSEDVELEDEEKVKEPKEPKTKEKKEPKKEEVELTKHDKMWNGVGENLKGIMTIIKDKDAEEIVSMLKNKIADGKLKFKHINAIKKTAKALNELMK